MALASCGLVAKPIPAGACAAASRWGASAQVLSRHPARPLALLQEAGLVDDENRVRIRQRLKGIVPHDVAQGVRIPATSPEHSLLTPGPRITGRLRPHPARLAPLIAQQTIEKQAR